MLNHHVRRVVFQPDSYLGMRRGINQMANVIRPTLGPLPRTVAVAHPLAHRTPELLDNGAVIARRLVELPDRDADMGAMFLRHVLWHVHEQTGDGTATAAVILQSVYNQGIRYLAAGGNPMKLRRYLEKGTRAILTELINMTTHIRGEQKLAQIAEAICHDPPLAKLIGEIFDIIGEYGRLEIKASQSRQLDREYVEGIYWDSNIISREMITNPSELKTDLEDAAIFLSNFDFTEPDHLIPIIRVTLAAQVPTLMVIGASFSEKAISLLLANSKSEKFQAIAVKVPEIGATKQSAALRDMAMLTGGSVFLKAVGQTNLDRLTFQDLGRARRVWANLRGFGIVGGKGNPRALRQHITELRAAYRAAKLVEDRQELQKRIGKLIGGSATLKIGGATNAEIKARKEVAEQTAQAIRGAIIEGVLPGGGVSFLACRPVLEKMLAVAADVDERAAYGILSEALAEPIRTIVGNAGYDPGEVLAKITQAGSGHGFDVMTGQVANMAEAGILDSAAVLKTAVQSAVASAALALTTEVLVHHKKPPMPAAAGPGSR
jgi:chaperonin GroEL